MPTLIKMSSPGWEKTFDTERELKAELFKHICKECCMGELAYVDPSSPTGTSAYLTTPVDENSSIGDMLGTACGCEFDVEGIEL